MGLRSIVLASVLVLVSASVSNAQRYVYGRFCSTCLGASISNQLYDDGLHHDGVAGDGEWGADIVSDVSPGLYSWYVAGPASINPEPLCDCAPPPALVYLWTNTQGEVVHFRVKAPPLNEPSVACDHGAPPGSQFEVAYVSNPPPPGWPGWSGAPGYPASQSGSLWTRVLTIPAAGKYVVLIRSTDKRVGFSTVYNASCSCSFDELPWWRFTTTLPNTVIQFQFDDQTGYLTTTVLASTDVRARTWGSMKTIYR